MEDSTKSSVSSDNPPRLNPPKEGNPNKGDVQQRVAVVRERQMNHMQNQLDEQSKLTGQLLNLPGVFDNMLKRMEQFTESFQYPQSDGKDKVPDTDIIVPTGEDDLSDLIPPVTTESESDQQGSVPCELLSILSTEEKDETCGPPLSEAVSSRFRKLINTNLSKESYDKLKQKLLTPENCKELVVPKMNPEVWNHLPTVAKSSEAKWQLTQQGYSKSMISFATIADIITTNSSVLPLDVSQSILRLALDGAALQAVGFREITYKRRQAIRPHLSPAYVDICNSKESASQFLFGNNLQDQVKASKSVNQIMKNDQGFKGQRFTPYGNANRASGPLNWRSQPRPSFRGRGMTRGWPRFQQSSVRGSRFFSPRNQRPQ